MNGQRFVNMMLHCELPHQGDLTGPALRVVATAAARGHAKKQEYDSGHTATRLFNSCKSPETIGRVSTHGRKLSYEDFLGALMRVAARVYPKKRAQDAFQALLHEFVMPHAYTRGSQLPFGLAASRAARMVSDRGVVDLLDDFAKPLLDVFHHANHRANRRSGVSRATLAAAAAAIGFSGGHGVPVSHSELLSYDDYLELCDVSFYFGHQQQQNILSVHDLGQVFVCVKEGGGHGLHPGHITFDEFLFAFCLLSLSMATSVARKYGVPPDEIAACDADMVKALLHRMASCPGIMQRKMRCYSKFKHAFQDMYRADGKPWRYLNVPGAPKRLVNARKVMRRMSISASGHVVEKTDNSQLGTLLGFDDANEDMYEADDGTTHRRGSVMLFAADGHGGNKTTSPGGTADSAYDGDMPWLGGDAGDVTGTPEQHGFFTTPGNNSNSNGGGGSRLQDPDEAGPAGGPQEREEERRPTLEFQKAVETVERHANDMQLKPVPAQGSPPPQPQPQPQPQHEGGSMSTAAIGKVEALRSLQGRLDALKSAINPPAAFPVPAATAAAGSSNGGAAGVPLPRMAAPPPPPPLGWNQKKDGNGMVYYFRKGADGGWETRWERPEDV